MRRSVGVFKAGGSSNAATCRLLRRSSVHQAAFAEQKIMKRMFVAIRMEAVSRKTQRHSWAVDSGAIPLTMNGTMSIVLVIASSTHSSSDSFSGQYLPIEMLPVTKCAYCLLTNPPACNATFTFALVLDQNRP